jgi:hypothetical protein
MKRIIVGVSSVVLASAFTVAKADIRGQLNVQTGKAELVVPGMEPNEVATKVKEAITQFAIPSNINFRSLPSTIPARPDEPQITQRYFQGAPVVEYHCPTAFAEITKNPAPVQNAFAYIGENLQICLYSFEKGTKAYLIFTRIRKTEALTAGLFGGITKAIQGTDGERITKQIQENIEEIKKGIPTLLIERFEVPGMKLQEPDKEAVAALIPPKSMVASQPVAVVAGGQKLLSSGKVGNNTAILNKIEARKSLTAMGLTYHSHEQFLAAVKRKDDVAVHQFLEAGGIDLASKDTNGKTSLEVANEVGEPVIIGLIEARLDSSRAPQANVSPPPTASEKITSLAIAHVETSATVAVAADEGLPPGTLESINAKLDSLDLPAEQKAVMRKQAISQIRSITSMVNRIDPDTGAIKR